MHQVNLLLLVAVLIEPVAIVQVARRRAERPRLRALRIVCNLRHAEEHVRVRVEDFIDRERERRLAASHHLRANIDTARSAPPPSCPTQSPSFHPPPIRSRGGSCSTRIAATPGRRMKLVTPLGRALGTVRGDHKIACELGGAYYGAWQLSFRLTTPHDSGLLAGGTP